MSFRRLLTALLSRVPFARGAIFCDQEGESIELAIANGRLTEFELKVFGAQLAAAFVSLDATAKGRGAGGFLEMRLSSDRGSLLACALPDGYYVLLVLDRGSAAAGFELRRTARELAAELQ
jgi:predicted regulator of Ras-like GTPase activity (Roadblock/LC7/MglB family)